MNINRVIYDLQGDVSTILGMVETLEEDEKNALLEEFRRRPDARFSDSQLVALSLYVNPILR